MNTVNEKGIVMKKLQMQGHKCEVCWECHAGWVCKRLQQLCLD